MFCFLTDFDFPFSSLQNELVYCSQYLLFKSLAYAQNMSAATPSVDNWLANWQSLTIKCKSDILILTS